jgi:hypothetical protein
MCNIADELSPRRQFGSGTSKAGTTNAEAGVVATRPKPPESSKLREEEPQADHDQFAAAASFAGVPLPR